MFPWLNSRLEAGICSGNLLLQARKQEGSWLFLHSGYVFWAKFLQRQQSSIGFGKRVTSSVWSSPTLLPKVFLIAFIEARADWLISIILTLTNIILPQCWFITSGYIISNAKEPSCAAEVNSWVVDRLKWLRVVCVLHFQFTTFHNY